MSMTMKEHLIMMEKIRRAQDPDKAVKTKTIRTKKRVIKGRKTIRLIYTGISKQHGLSNKQAS